MFCTLKDALKFGVIKDFSEGEKRDEFAGLLENAARKDTPFGMGLVADFADDHNHPLAPVFRRIANGEAEEGTIEHHARRLPDETFADPQFSFNLHSKTASVREPYASVDLLHHFERGPIWQVRTHTGWPNGIYGDWPEGKSYLLPATAEEMDKVAAEYGADDKPMVAEGIKRFRDAIQQQTAEHHRSADRPLRYGVAEAKGLYYDHSGNSSATNKLHSAVRAFITKDDRSALAGLADLLEENDHPLAPIVAKVFAGEAREVDSYSSDWLKQFARRPAGDEYGIHLTTYTGMQSPSAGGHREIPVIGLTPLRLKDGQNYFRLNFQGSPGDLAHNKTPQTDIHPTHRTFLVPATEEEIDNYAKGMAEINSDHSEAILTGDSYGTSDYSLNRYHENRHRTAVGLPPIPTEEAAVHHRSLSEALKYITAKPEEWTHHLADPQKRDLHLIWADVLNDNGKDQLAESVRSEAERPKRGVVPRPEEGPAYRVLTELNHRHPSPAIRALADNAIKEVYNNLSDFTPSDSEALLIDALRKSEHPADQDAGVFLSASEDYPHQHHPAAKHLKHLQRHQFANAGLHPRLIGDTLYLLDENHPEAESYGAPAIRYHAHIGDKQDLDGLVAHAEQLRQQQEAL